MSSIYIELTGLPASGKTMLYHKLSAKFSQQGQTIINRNKILLDFALSQKEYSLIQKMKWRLRYIRGKNIYIPNIEKHIESTEIFLKLEIIVLTAIDESILSDDWKNKTKDWFYHDWFIHSLQKGATFILSDEGFIHRTLSFFTRAEDLDKEAIKEYLSLVPRPDILIYLNTDIKTVLSRLEKRKSIAGFPDLTTKIDKALQLQNMQHCLEFIIDHMKDDIKIIPIFPDADGSLQDISL